MAFSGVPPLFLPTAGSLEKDYKVPELFLVGRKMFSGPLFAGAEDLFNHQLNCSGPHIKLVFPGTRYLPLYAFY